MGLKLPEGKCPPAKVRTLHLLLRMIPSAGASQNERCNSSLPAARDSESATCDVPSSSPASTTAEVRFLVVPVRHPQVAGVLEIRVTEVALWSRFQRER